MPKVLDSEYMSDLVKQPHNAYAYGLKGEINDGNRQYSRISLYQSPVTQQKPTGIERGPV